jgi:hypothetical protein
VTHPLLTKLTRTLRSGSADRPRADGRRCAEDSRSCSSQAPHGSRVAPRSRSPTTDTYSLEQTQEEFFFALSYDRMDLCLYARDHDVPAADAAKVLNLTADQVTRVYKDIDAKRKAAHYLHAAPLLVTPQKDH